jgi:hypothetical protein
MTLHHYLARLRRRLFTGFLRSWQRPIRRQAAARARVLPRLEGLEERLAPASYLVTPQLQVLRTDTAGGDVGRQVVFFESGREGSSGAPPGAGRRHRRRSPGRRRRRSGRDGCRRHVGPVGPGQVAQKRMPLGSGGYASRVNRLVNDPTYALSLNSGTVHSNGGGNTLTGKPGGSTALDLYFAALALGDTTDAGDSDTVVTTA